VPLVKQQYIIYQVQLRVLSGEAHFDKHLPTGQTTLTPKDGWVALDTIFDQIVKEEDPEHPIPIPSSGPNGRGQLHYKPGDKRKPKPDPEPTEDGEAGGEDDKQVNRCSLDRAKMTFREHQLGTLRRLEKKKCLAQLRLMPFEQKEPVMQTDKSYNVEIFDEV
jgi:hypothetical protein